MPFLELGPRDRLLVRAASDSGPTAATAWEEWFAGTELEDVPYPEGRLLTQVFANLNAQGLVGECLPPLVRGKYRWVWTSNQLRVGAVLPGLRALEAAGIATLLLKGAALLAAERCVWGAREMGDVDVLVPTAQAGRAAEVLVAAGWTGVGGVTPRYLAQRLVARRHGWNFEGGPSASIDLHWHAFEGVGGPHADNMLWAAAPPVIFGGVDTKRLDDADHLVHTLEHASHGEEAHRLVWLVDVAAVLPHVDEERLVRVATAMSLRDLVADGLEIAGSVLESEQAWTLARRVASERRGARGRLLALTAGPGVARVAPRLTELTRTALVQTGGAPPPLAGAAAVLRRRIEPDVVARPAVSAALALFGHPRRAEVAALRYLGPLTRAVDAPIFATGEWIEITPALLDAIGGPGWSWPAPDGGGVWTDGAEARLALDLGPLRGRDLVLGFRFGADAHRSPNPLVQVRVNGRSLEAFPIGPDPETGPRHSDVPAWLADWCRPMEVVLRPFHPFDPWARRGAPGDQRRFAQLRALRVDVR